MHKAASCKACSAELHEHVKSNLQAARGALEKKKVVTMKLSPHIYIQIYTDTLNTIYFYVYI